MWLGRWALQLDGLQREKRRASFVFTGEASCECFDVLVVVHVDVMEGRERMFLVAVLFE